MEPVNDVVSLEFVFVGGVRLALIRVDNPPVNAAGHALRQGLMRAVERLEAEGVSAAGLYCAGRTFTAGADIREFGQPLADPGLPETCDRLEDSAVPIVAAMHGTALGGGFEIALACHARIGLPGLRVGFPEVALGILPGAGGTQRAPRLAGQAVALQLAITGKPMGAEAALKAGLIDEIATGATDPRAVALEGARRLTLGDMMPRRTGDLSVTPDHVALAAQRAESARKTPYLVAPPRIVEAIAASALPLAEGLARERRLFAECYDDPQRAALVHAFFAERAAARIPEGRARPRPLSRIGIIGAGTMGSGIATACLLAGLPVTLVERAQDALDRGTGMIAANLNGALKRGKLSEEGLEAARTALTPGTDMAALAGADLIIEAAFEKLEVKTGIFNALDKIARPGAVLASNTSYLDVDKIAAATTRPGDVIGMHFFSPAHVMRLLEVVVGTDTAPEAVATAFALAKKLGKVPVRARVCDGFIGNRILEQYIRAADLMVLDGAPPHQVDAAVRGFGMAMGPYEMSDLAGLDVGYLNRQNNPAGKPRGRRYNPLSDRIVEAGWLGRKSGLGYYDYSGQTPVPNPGVQGLLDQVRAGQGITPRDFTDQEIVDRYLTAFIAEAADVVDEGIALRASDVDTVFLFGYGFPRHKGGPLFEADRIGAAEIQRRLRAYASEDPEFWRDRPLINRLAESGQGFADLPEEA